MERIAEYPINQIFPDRWSPRSMDGNPLEEKELFSLLEAARWSPSSGNAQPWRYLYARAGTDHFQTFFNLLAPGNQSWCKRAGALLVVVSKKFLDSGRLSPTHSYDAGASWMSFALQASMNGLVAHGMAGFDFEKARTELEIPEEYHVNAMIAVGYPGNAEDLTENERSREKKSPRKPIQEFIFEGKFHA